MAENTPPQGEEAPQEPQGKPAKKPHNLTRDRTRGDTTPSNVIKLRVQEIYKLRLGGAEFPDLWKLASDKGWGVSQTTLRRYIHKADALCQKYYDANAKFLLSRHLLQRRQLYAHCMGSGDFRTALSVLRDEAELTNLYPAKKIEQKDTTGQPVEQMTDAELARIAGAGNADSSTGSTGNASPQGGTVPPA